MSAIDTQAFPRGALIAAGALVGFSLLATTFVRLERLGSPTIAAVRPAPLRAVDVRFATRRTARSASATATMAM